MATPQLSINGFDLQENLVSTRDGRNIRRSFDGARLTWLKRDWAVDLLAVAEDEFDRVVDPAKMVHPYVAKVS
jgi:Alginate export